MNIEDIIKQNPRLRIHGLDGSDDYQYEFLPVIDQFKKYKPQIDLCCEYLGTLRPQDTINPYMDSYAVKHQVERWACNHRLRISPYIPEGVLIAAAIAMGISYQWGKNDIDWSSIYLAVATPKKKYKRKYVIQWELHPGMPQSLKLLN